jgi:hypothetical protein
LLREVTVLEPVAPVGSRYFVNRSGGVLQLREATCSNLDAPVGGRYLVNS